MRKVKEKVVRITNSEALCKQIRELIKVKESAVQHLVEPFEDGPILDQLQFMFDLMKTRISKHHIYPHRITLRAPWLIMKDFYETKGLNKLDELVITGSMFHHLNIESWIRLVRFQPNGPHGYAYYTIPASQQELEDDDYFSFCPAEFKEFDEEPQGYSDPIMIRMT